MSSRDTAPEDTTAEDTTAEDTTAEDAIAEDATTGDATAGDATTRDTTAEQATAKDATAKDTAEDSTAKDATTRGGTAHAATARAAADRGGGSRTVTVRRGGSGAWPRGASRVNSRTENRRQPLPRVNPLKHAGITYIDYKDTDLLRKFLSDRGKIRSRRVTKVTARQQRQLARAIKNAREMALLPYRSTSR